MSSEPVFKVGEITTLAVSITGAPTGDDRLVEATPRPYRWLNPASDQWVFPGLYSVIRPDGVHCQVYEWQLKKKRHPDAEEPRVRKTEVVV